MPLLKKSIEVVTPKGNLGHAITLMDLKRHMKEFQDYLIEDLGKCIAKVENNENEEEYELVKIYIIDFLFKFKEVFGEMK